MVQKSKDKLNRSSRIDESCKYGKDQDEAAHSQQSDLGSAERWFNQACERCKYFQVYVVCVLIRGNRSRLFGYERNDTLLASTDF